MSETLRRCDPVPAVWRQPSGLLPAHVVMVGQDHPLRGRVERFVEARYERAFSAQLRSHYELIGAVVDSEEGIHAAAGVRFAEREPLFLEQYLDEPIEQALAAAFGRPVARDGVVEIGAFAADAPDASLTLFGGLAQWLGTGCARRFAVATARPELRRLLDHSGFPVVSLGAADPARLSEDVAGWGRYYDARPEVLAGAIRRSDVLPLLRRRLRTQMMARQARRLRRTAP